MTEYAVSIDIQAPPDRVWAIMSDVRRWHEWTASITSIRRLDEGPLRVGSRAMVRQPKVPPALWRVTELEEGRRFSWVTGSPIARATGHHSVEPLADGSRATLALEFSGILGALFARLLDDINRRYLTMEANGLKARSEGTA
jgi:uncharacterized membrane protein